jgi:hypothetical protein
MNVNDPHFADDDVITVYLGGFAGRSDLYVENGGQVIRQPLTPTVIRHAIEHDYAVSAYLGTADGKTHVGAIDFDTDDGLTTARTIQRWLLERSSIPSLLSHSRRGAHLWVTTLDYTTTAQMRRALQAALSLSGGPHAVGNPKVEVFPKKDEGLGVGALRLPGMPHQRTQQVYPIERSVAGQADWATLEEPTFDQIIEAQVLTTAEGIDRLAMQCPLPRTYPKVDAAFYGYSERRFSDTPKASEVLASWGVQVRPGGTVRCPAHDDQRRSLTVFRDDERVYCGAPHCPLNAGGHGVGSVQLSTMRPPPGG